ncbi:MAG: superfamily endonuclease [Polaromonas sp.]|nr:superfamily endonuclease [Polaromonas sp.]
MSALLSRPPAPGPLEAFAVQFDPLLKTPAQRHGFRAYLSGLLLPRERSKTLTALVGAEPLVQAQAAEVQRLQFFLSEAAWDAEAVNARRLTLLLAEPATAPSTNGVLIIDDTGDRKEGCATDHVARQYLGSVGKIDNGIVAVTTLWADEARYYPLHVMPYTPEKRLAGGKQDPAFCTKPQIALNLVEQAPSRRHPVLRHRGGLFLWRQQCARDRAAQARPASCVGAPRRRWARLGAGRGGSLFQGRRAGAAAECLAARDSPLSGRSHRALVGRRAHAVRLWAGPAGARRVRHDRSARVARPVDLVPHHQFVARAGPAGRSRAAVRIAQLGRAKLQTDEGRAWLGRLHGPKRPGDPPPLDARVLRVCLLLVASRVASRYGRLAARWYRRSAARGGEKKPAPSRRCRAGRACCARCAPG